MPELVIAVTIAAWVGLAAYAGIVAARQGHNDRAWFLLGILLGPAASLAMIAILVFERGRTPTT